MTQNNGDLRAFLRSSPVSSNKPLAVRLVAAAGNPTAVGARVSLIAKERRIAMAEVRAGTGYLSQSTTSVFFTLPSSSDGPFRLEIRWPDGNSSRTELTKNTDQIVIQQPAS